MAFNDGTARNHIMQGKTCLVTGATSGIGLVAARELARKGADVILCGRDKERITHAKRTIEEACGRTLPEPIRADLSVQAEVRQLAETMRYRVSRLDVLVNNAGAIFDVRRESADGIEMTFALNQMSYFLLTQELRELLTQSAPARIVNVASGAHWGVRGPVADWQLRQKYSGWGAYCQSKLANVLFTFALARKLEGTGVTANCLHPGFVRTRFGGNNSFAMSAMIRFGMLFAISVEKGAQTSIYLASDPQIATVTGEYFAKCRPEKTSALARDVALQDQLWQACADAVR